VIHPPFLITDLQQEYIMFCLFSSVCTCGSVISSLYLFQSERVSDCCLTLTQAIFQLYHGENKLMLNEIMMRSALF
jgi:hypothetical protein